MILVMALACISPFEGLEYVKKNKDTSVMIVFSETEFLMGYPDIEPGP